MSLFVGNISNTVRQSDLEKYFEEFGDCRIKFKGSYSFIEYNKDHDAEAAFKNLQNKKIGGREINIEWSKQSGRYDASKSNKRRNSNSPKRVNRAESRCFNCNMKGHYARECRERRRRSRSRSRQRSRSHRRNRSRSKSRDRRRSKDRSRSRRKNERKSRSKSSSKKRDRSGSRKRSFSKYSSSSKSRSKSKKDDRSPSQNGKSYSKPKDDIINNLSPTNSNRMEEPISQKNSPNKPKDENQSSPNEYVYQDNRVAKLNSPKQDQVDSAPKDGLDVSKLKVEDLKAELTKLEVPFSKNAKKQELQDLLKQNLATK